MKYCSKCGIELDDSLKICTGCGCRVSKKIDPRLLSLFDKRRTFQGWRKDDLFYSFAEHQEKPNEKRYQSNVPLQSIDAKSVAEPSTVLDTTQKPNSERVETIQQNVNYDRRYKIKREGKTDGERNFERLTFLGVISICLSVIAFFLSCQFVVATCVIAVSSLIVGIICIALLPRDAKGYIGTAISMISIVLAFVSQYQV